MGAVEDGVPRRGRPLRDRCCDLRHRGAFVDRLFFEGRSRASCGAGPSRLPRVPRRSHSRAYTRSSRRSGPTTIRAIRNPRAYWPLPSFTFALAPIVGQGEFATRIIRPLGYDLPARPLRPRPLAHVSARTRPSHCCGRRRCVLGLRVKPRTMIPSAPAPRPPSNRQHQSLRPAAMLRFDDPRRFVCCLLSHRDPPSGSSVEAVAGLERADAAPRPRITFSLPSFTYFLRDSRVHHKLSSWARQPALEDDLGRPHGRSRVSSV